MPLLPTSYEKPVKVTIQLLSLLRVRVTDETINDCILSHPDYPSLLSISDTLNQWNIPHTALRVEKERLDELPVPFLAYTRGDFKVITDITGEKISYLNDENKYAEESMAQFHSNWEGIALIAEADHESGDREYFEKRKKEKRQKMVLPLLLVVLVTLGTLSSIIFFTHNTLADAIAFSLLVCLKLAGILITGILLWYETDKFNPVMQKICAGSSSKTSCNAILNSKASRPFSFISWSEAGFFYFMGGFLLLTLDNSPISLSSLALLNFISLPYIIYSVFYQWRIAKQWCRLCLSVQAILIIEAIVNLSAGLNSFDFISYRFFLFFIVVFTIPAAAWFIIKPYLVKEKGERNNKYELARIKADRDIFYTVLQKQKQLKKSTDGLGIMLGNPAAANSIIKVCNPYCGPCAKAHPEIDRLLKNNDRINVRIIFTASALKDDVNALPVRHLLAIDAKGDKQMTLKALDDWYLSETKDYAAFAAKYPMNGKLIEQDEKLSLMKKWCDDNQIQFTPTIFFNGYQLPEMYRVSDLKSFINEE